MRARNTSADTAQEAEKKLANSLETLKTDYADILYFHNLGRLKRADVKRAQDPDGVFTWLLSQKESMRRAAWKGQVLALTKAQEILS